MPGYAHGVGPSVLSCSALLFACGLSSACGGETKGSDASNGSAGSGASSGGNGEIAGTAGIAGSVGSGPVPTSDSAQWPMPNSPGLGMPNPESYDATSIPGVVHDRVTGLDWLQDPGTELYPRADALMRCSALSFAGFDDWRVPEFIELVSLFDVVPNDADPLAPIYIAPTFKAEGRYWSTSAVTSDGLGRLLDFTADGCLTVTSCSVGVAGKASEALGGAFCVRSSRPPATSARYQSTGGEVSDLRTGLIWLTVPSTAQTSGYDDAVSTCASLGNGARLPSITELLSLVVPILDKKAFPGWPADAFAWSSSGIFANPGTFWVGAIGGATRADLSTAHNRVQCVR